MGIVFANLEELNIKKQVDFALARRYFILSGKVAEIRKIIVFLSIEILVWLLFIENYFQIFTIMLFFAKKSFFLFK